MLTTGEDFPYQPISAEKRFEILQYCGGLPVNDIEPVRSFLALSGLSLVNHFPLKQLLQNSRATTMTALGIEDETAPTSFARINFNRGCYLYAGLYRHARDAESLIIDPRVVTTVLTRVEDDPKDFGLEAYQRAQEIPSFHEMMEVVGPVLIGSEQKHQQAAMVGAGTLHYIVVESEALEAEKDPLDLAFPELEIIAYQFDGLAEPPEAP